MKPDPARAEAIFLAAAEIVDPQERSTFLDRECGDDPALRARVEALLASHHEAGDFLDISAPSPEMEAKFARLKPEEAGERIGHYKLLQQIGEGGFGVVWMAEQEKPVRRRVALKIIKLGMDTKEVIARFEQERQALAMMDHPNIAKVFDAGATPFGRPFFVMELVRGIKITDYCDQASLPTADRLQLFIAVCQAVQHAHQKGIIHRDLKPSNILVTLHDGVPVPKVIDFGVAKAIQARLTERTLFTQFQQMIGTPLYMSPEQAEMSGLDVDTRSDIYSLGVLLYELLTGRTPFDAETLQRAGLDEIRRIIREQEAVKPSTVLQTLVGAARTTIARNRQCDAGKLTDLLRGDLDWIVMKALEKDRSRRYDTANGLAKDIGRHLADEPVLARPPSQLYRFKKLARRNKVAFTAAGAVSVAVLLALIVLVTSLARVTKEKVQKDRALQEKGVALQEKGTALAEAQTSAQAARDQLFLALFSSARAGRFSGQMGQRFDSLRALTEAARIRPDERLRDEAIVAMALPDVRPGPSWHWNTDEAVDESYRFSAIVDAEGIITVRSVPDRREVGRIESGCQTRALFFSKDGRYLAQYVKNHTWRVWLWADAHSVLGEPIQGKEGMAFSPDNRHIAIGQNDYVLRISLATGLEVNRWRARRSIHSLAFNGDNRRLAVGYFHSDIASIYDAVDGKNLADLPIGGCDFHVLAWHPDGIRLAIGSSNPRIQIWDVDAKRKRATLDGHVLNVTRLTFHPDGEILASDGWEGVCRIWQPSSGRQLMQFPYLGPFSFSKDGQYLGGAGIGNDRRLLEVASCPEYRTIVSSLGPGEGDYYNGDISPDNRLFALGMRDGVRLWDTLSWRELAFLPVGLTMNVNFQPDGTQLITCGPGGLQRWPIQVIPEAPSEMRLGPPTNIPVPFSPNRMCLSQDSTSLAVISESGGGPLIVNVATGSVQSPPIPQGGGSYVALSRDGQWMASSGWNSDRARLWNVASRKMVKEWIIGTQMGVSFTPDSRTLITCRREGFDFWDVVSFQPVRHLRCEAGDALRQVAFSPDGKLMAIAMASVVHLLETASGRTVAKIEDPHGDRVTWIGFNTDGTQLLTATNYAKAIHAWDFRAIRARLKGMQLDWDWPEFPAQGEHSGLQPFFPDRVRKIEVIPNRE